MAEKKSGIEKIRAKRQGKLPNEQADWGTVDPTVVLNAIANVAYVGGALRFGYTRDGGAYAIGIYLGGEHWTEYVRPSEDVLAYLSALVSDVRGDI